MSLATLSNEDYEMARCPFCFSDKVRVHEYQSHGTQYVVLCLNLTCNARGPRRYDADEAMDAWNRVDFP